MRNDHGETFGAWLLKQKIARAPSVKLSQQRSRIVGFHARDLP
jgi:hypothetical protein